MKKKRRIAVVTGTRAEFGLLEPVLRAMAARPGLDPRLIVTGMHLLRKFGRTVDHIRAAGWRVDATVPMQTGRDDAGAEAAALAGGIAGIGRALERMDCEIVLVLGDRIEAFAGACAAVAGRRVLAHIHGGDRGTGDIDDVLRNAITRMAHVHLVASQDAADRLLRMGEEAFRIHQVGAPGLDDIRQFREVAAPGRGSGVSVLRTLLGSVADRPYAVVIQHPAGRTGRRESVTMGRILQVVDAAGLGGVIIYPNSDPGHDGIIGTIQRWDGREGWRVFRSLTRPDYLRVVMGAAVMVGNSSSGIIESASLGVNAVNIGLRQQDRLRCGTSVIDCGESLGEIRRALQKALRSPRPRPGRSVYGDGRAGIRMAALLDRLKINPRLTRKALAY